MNERITIADELTVDELAKLQEREADMTWDEMGDDEQRQATTNTPQRIIAGILLSASLLAGSIAVVGLREVQAQEPATTITAIEEGFRFGVRDWAEYKQRIWSVETLLRSAGVDAATVRRAILDLDEAAVGLYTSGHADALDLGIETGRMLEAGHPFAMHLPGGRG